MSEQSAGGTYRCFGPYCSTEFDTLEDMVFVAGARNRSGRHFCPRCARNCRRTPEEAYRSLLDAGRSGVGR